MDPDFGQTAPINMHNEEISLTSDAQESWFEKLIEFFIGKLVPLISITLQPLALSLDHVFNKKIIYFPLNHWIQLSTTKQLNHLI